MTVFAEVKNKITSWGNEIKTKIKTIGTNLVTGLWNGISDKAEWVKSKIGGFGSDIINKIKSVFGVHSPSTVMKQIGDFLMQGLSIGVDSNAYKPIRSVSNVGDEMTRAFDFDGSVEHIGGAIGGAIALAVIVAIVIYLCINAEKKLKAEYALKSEKEEARV